MLKLDGDKAYCPVFLAEIKLVLAVKNLSIQKQLSKFSAPVQFCVKTSGRMLLFFVPHNLLFCSESGQLCRFECIYSTVQIVGRMSCQMSMLSRKWFELGNLHNVHILLDMSILKQLENIVATIEIIFSKNISRINLFST